MFWLNALSRHFRVAALKLVQHDTFRLIEDERGVHATDKCPVAGIAIRIEAMLSLMSDVGLLNRTEDGYMIDESAANWTSRQLYRLYVRGNTRETIQNGVRGCLWSAKWHSSPMLLPLRSVVIVVLRGMETAQYAVQKGKNGACRSISFRKLIFRQ